MLTLCCSFVCFAVLLTGLRCIIIHFYFWALHVFIIINYVIIICARDYSLAPCSAAVLIFGLITEVVGSCTIV